MKSIGWVIGGTSGIGLEAATRLEGLVDQVVVVGPLGSLRAPRSASRFGSLLFLAPKRATEQAVI